MHVGIGCSGTYGETATIVTTTRAIQTSTTTPSADEQTVIDVLNRHNWTDIAAVIDVTGSMSSCYAHIDQWVALSEKNKFVKYFVFFNDGDGIADKDKVIGSTGKAALKRDQLIFYLSVRFNLGGIYSVYANEGMTKVKEILNTAKRNGGGGDTPENDIEAIIYTLSTCSTCKNVIHIADNGATPRDMILLNQVTKPIKVVVCKLGENSFVNPKLLDIAYKTGGSLHTLDMDIETLGSFEVGDTIKVGDGTYRLTVNGFVRVA
ncbi:unnamed protein product [Rotaria magnacalcarata]